MGGTGRLLVWEKTKTRARDEAERKHCPPNPLSSLVASQIRPHEPESFTSMPGLASSSLQSNRSFTGQWVDIIVIRV